MISKTPPSDGSRTKFIATEYRLVRADNQKLSWLKVVGRVNYDENGNRTDYVGLQLDVTEHRELENAFRENEKRMAFAQEVAGVGIFERNLITDEGFWSPSMYKIRGLEVREGAPTLSDSFSMMISAEMEEKIRKDLAMIPTDQQLRNGRRSTREFSIIPKGGNTPRHFLETCHITYGPDRRATHIIGAQVDITRLKNALDELEVTNDRFRLIAAAMQGAVNDRNLITDTIVRGGNYEAVFGYKPEEMHLVSEPGPMTSFNLVHPDDRPRILTEYHGHLHGGSTSYRMLYRVRHRSGNYVYVENHSIIIRDPSGNPTRTIANIINVDEREKARAALIENEERLRIFAEATQSCIIDYDLKTHEVKRSGNYEEVFGYKIEDLPSNGRDFLIQPSMMHEEDALEALRITKHAIETGMRHFKLSFRLKHKNGHWVHVDTRGSIVRDPSGRAIRIVAGMIDVTREKLAQTTQNLLAREVDHRAKNTLATVSSVVRLTRANTIGEFRTAVEQRIDSLGRAHTLLAGQAWHGASLMSLVSGEIKAYDDDGRCFIEGPDIEIEPTRVQPLSMILHELTTNAAKYGALKQTNGRLTITWETDEDHLIIHWTETGCTGVVQPTRTGFGTMLINNTLGYQIAGNIETQWKPTGVVRTINIGKEAVVIGQTKFEIQDQSEETPAIDLTNLRVLVIEDDSLISAHLIDVLEDLGCVPVGPFKSNAEAIAAIDRGEKVDVALVDVNLGQEYSIDLTSHLIKLRIPLAFTTGYNKLPPEMAMFGKQVLIQKPLTLKRLIGGLQVLAERLPKRGISSKVV